MAAALDDGIQDGATFPGFGVADEEPVLFAQGSGPDGILHEVLVDLDMAIVKVDAEQFPVAQGVIKSLAHAAAGQEAAG
jgi:hypothetical protein